MAKRYYTLEEANELVIWLEECFEAIRPINQRVEELSGAISEIQNRMRSNGGSEQDIQLRRIRQDAQEAALAIQEKVTAITEIGIIVRRVEDGLVDFPTMRDGREVQLCWQSGEPTIGYWHEVDTGFDSRQPV